MSRKSLIVSLENDGSLAEPVEMVPLTSVDNVSTLNEIESQQEEMEDIHEDVVAVESYLALLKDSDYNLSQEAYSAMLIGVGAIYNKYGMGHKLSSFESYFSQRELAVSLEGLGGAIYDHYKRHIKDVIDLVIRNVKSTRAEKKRFIEELKELETEMKSKNIKKDGKIQQKSFGQLFSAAGKSLTSEREISSIIDNTIEYLSLFGTYKEHIKFCDKLLDKTGESMTIFKTITGIGMDNSKRSYDIEMSPFFEKLLTEKASRDVVGDFLIKNKNGAGRASKTVIGAHTAYYVSSTPRWYDWVILTTQDNYKFGVYDNKGNGQGEVDVLKDPLKIVKKYREALEVSLGYEDAADDNKFLDAITDFNKWFVDGFNSSVVPGATSVGLPTIGLVLKFCQRYTEYITEMMKSPAVQFNSRIVRETSTLIRYFRAHIEEK